MTGIVAEQFQEATEFANDNSAPKSLCQIFNAFTAESMRDFPEIEGKLEIYNAVDKTWHGYHIAKFISEEQLSIEIEAYQRLFSGGVEGPQGQSLKGGLCFIGADAPFFYMIGIAEKNTKNIHNLYMALDHELAHCVIKEAGIKTDDLVKKNLRECIADAYAMIRHYQRFGSESNYVDTYIHPISRAYNALIYADVTHYTLSVLEEVIQMRDRGFDFRSLSSSETAALALTLAKEYQPLPELLYALQNKEHTHEDVIAVTKKALQNPYAKETPRSTQPGLTPSQPSPAHQ